MNDIGNVRNKIENRFYLFLVLLMIGCNLNQKKNYYCTYASEFHPYILKTDFDTMNCKMTRFSDYGGYTEVWSDYCPNQIIQFFLWGPRQPPSVNLSSWSFNPFSNYQYDIDFVKNWMDENPEKQPIYFVKFDYYNGKKFISTAYETRKLGITFESNYFCDSLVFVVQTVFRNQYDTSMIDMHYHSKLLQNSIIDIE